VFKRPEYPGWSEEDTFYGGYGEDMSPYGGEVVVEGDAVTDDAGHVTIAVPTAKIAPGDAHERTSVTSSRSRARTRAGAWSREMRRSWRPAVCST
jgi:hypothetical protein